GDAISPGSHPPDPFRTAPPRVRVLRRPLDEPLSETRPRPHRSSRGHCPTPPPEKPQPQCRPWPPVGDKTNRPGSNPLTHQTPPHTCRNPTPASNLRSVFDLRNLCATTTVLLRLQPSR
ncbi:unnamed protein product, partial [Sphacelaria rigidula]